MSRLQRLRAFLDGGSGFGKCARFRLAGQGFADSVRGPMDKPVVAIVGVGMIGASLGLALQQKRWAREVWGLGRSRETLNKALELGAITRIADAPMLAEADCVVLCVPMLAYDAALQRIAPHLRADAVLTDAGSTKRHAVAAARRALGARASRFVGAHPIAGSERSGPEAARADLFAGRPCILTPAGADPEARARAKAMWEAAGAKIEEMDPEAHDALLARVSHLPHLAAYALVDAIVALAGEDEPFRLAGAGFRDFTRIASSSPEMWRDITLANADMLVSCLDAYLAELARLRDAVARGDADYLQRVFTRAKQARDAWLRRERADG